MSFPSASDRGSTFIIYDGDCPFCSRYVRLLRLKQSLGEVRLINARQGGDEVIEARVLGYDIDEGMLLKLDGRYYYGDECIHKLALLSTSIGWFNRINATMFSNPKLASVLYPILRAGRNLTLRLLGRKKIG